MTHYDRDSDIAYFEVSGVGIVRSVEHEWGLVDLDANGGVVGIELWSASESLPASLLAALPQLTGEPTIIERQPA